MCLCGRALHVLLLLVVDLADPVPGVVVLGVDADGVPVAPQAAHKILVRKVLVAAQGVGVPADGRTEEEWKRNAGRAGRE